MSTTTSTTVIESTTKLIEDTTTLLAEVLTSSTEGESSDWRVGWVLGLKLIEDMNFCLLLLCAPKKT